LPLFAQHAAPSDGRDFKVYAIGDQLWARTRTWPTRRPEDKLGAPAVLPPAIRDAALAAGQALGLELYGVDFLVAHDQFVAIDVNPFPGYHGITDAPKHLADYIYNRALGGATASPYPHAPMELLR
jgi:ribosomal protein S6--L-glutamate ligase